MFQPPGSILLKSRLPAAVLAILVVVIIAVVASRSFPERIIAVPHADRTATLDGKKMQWKEAAEWIRDCTLKRHDTPSWWRRDFVLETQLPPGLPCEAVDWWLRVVCLGGLVEMKIAFEVSGKTERVSFFAMGGWPGVQHFGLIEGYTPYQPQDQVRLQKDGTSVRFRWLRIRADGIVFAGKTLPLDDVLRDLRPQPNDCYIFICQRDTPFEPVLHLQRSVEASGCLPSALVIE